MGTQIRPTIQMELSKSEILPFIGVYDVFSASIAARYYNGLFLSGFSFAASFYGLPDIGFITWSDMVAFVQRVRVILPYHLLMVDIDDGYVDIETAAHVIALLESVGASGVVLEDQKRPRRCGHFDGKVLMQLDDFLEKLGKVLQTRKELFVVARTDATEESEIVTRIQAFQEAGADAVLVEAVREISFLKKIVVSTNCPVMVNKIYGGKTPDWSFRELKDAGILLVNYSTPCLFAAQREIEKAMKLLKENDGVLGNSGLHDVDVNKCKNFLHENLKKRDE